MGSPSKTVVWFRRDLRIEDNPALAAAAKDGCILPIYIWCPKEEGQFHPGRVSRWWLKQSLTHLDQSLRTLGVGLTLIKADSTIDALLNCISTIGATRVVFNQLYDPVSLVRDHNIKQQLVELGISISSFNGDLLYEPWEVYDKKGYAFTTFDAYWEKCKTMVIEPVSLLPPWRLVPATETIESCSVEELGLENELEKSSNALLSRGWSPGWSNADKVLTEFIDQHLLNYSKNRFKVDGNSTSLLSPYLHFGELSVRKVFQCIRMKQIQWAREGNSIGEESTNLFLRALGLREYSRYICFNFPFTHERSLMGHLRHFPWRIDQGEFKAWRQGRTGYPLVDAGMRELWATGWIHNKTRVIVSSFFIKFLLLPWTWGLKYFWDTLLDADAENDILGWQYISGSLPDGHELDRLDSPQVQGCKFDPEGEYVRRWLPELARLPTPWIHHPWDAPASVLRSAGVDLGLNYPKPIVEIAVAQDRLADIVSTLREVDAAARAIMFDTGREVVADNLNAVENHLIPRVVIKRVSNTSSSHDQRVPSMQNPEGCNERKALKGLNGERLKQDNLNNHDYNVETSTIEEDLCSTAQSPVVRKQGLSQSQYCVLPSRSSSSNVELLEELRNPKLHVPVESPPTLLWKMQLNMDQPRTQKEEREVYAHTVLECSRPCKRPA